MTNNNAAPERIGLPNSYALIRMRERNFEDMYQILAPEGILEDGPCFHLTDAQRFATAMQPVPSESDEAVAREIWDALLHVDGKPNNIIGCNGKTVDDIAAILARHRHPAVSNTAEG